MKKSFLFLSVLFSLYSLSASPWVDDAFLTVETESPKKIQRMIETDYSVKKFTRSKDKENLLMAALKNARGNDVVALLLDDAKISPDSKTKSGVSAFMYACQYENDLEAVRAVLFKNAKKDSLKAKRILEKDKEGNTSFDYARKNENISQDVLELLALYAEEPVREAVQEQSLEAEENASEPLLNEESQSLPDASEALPVIQPQKENVPEENTEPEPDAPAGTFMDFSALSSPNVVPESIYLYDYADDKYAQVPIPESLIAAEKAKHNFIPDANLRSSNGRTKLMEAAREGDIAKIEDLLYSGAELNAKDNDGWTALMYAARYQMNPDTIKLLLYKGADSSVKNNYGLSALSLAAGYTKNPEVLSLLLESYSANSEEVRAAFAYGISSQNSSEVLQAFIEKHVALDVPYKGKTPLMLACQTNKNTKLIEWLMEKGASKYQIDSATGKTAFDYAKENRRLPHNVAYWALNPNS